MSASLCSMLLAAGCAASEPEAPQLVHPSEAQGIEPPPGVELTDSECLVGGWRVEGEPLQEYVLTFGPGTEIEVGGYLTLGFTLDRYYVEPRVGITWQNRGQETLASLVGEAEGTYRLEGAIFEATEEQENVDLVDVEQGERGRVPELFLHPITMNPLAGASVSCAGDSLSVTTSVGGAVVRVDFARLR